MATMNHWKEVTSQILDRIASAGLLEATTRLHLGVVGQQDAATFATPKIVVMPLSQQLKDYEFPTLRMLWQHCQITDCFLYYLHTKGVSYGPNPKSDRWRNSMLNLIVDRWSESVQALAQKDACGGIYRHRRRYFAGNFWWSKSAYIRTLAEPRFVRSRLDAERWLLDRSTPESVQILR